MVWWYKVAHASEFLVITGYGIKDIKLAKKAWIFPGQSCTVFDVSPVNYTFEVQAMSAEKLPFLLPAVFTIGPRIDDIEGLLKYAKLISPHDKLSNHVKELVQGVIEGETRVLAASMTMEEIFRGMCLSYMKHFFFIFFFIHLIPNWGWDVYKTLEKNEIYSLFLTTHYLVLSNHMDTFVLNCN